MIAQVVTVIEVLMGNGRVLKQGDERLACFIPEPAPPRPPILVAQAVPKLGQSALGGCVKAGFGDPDEISNREQYIVKSTLGLLLDNFLFMSKTSSSSFRSPFVLSGLSQSPDK